MLILPNPLMGVCSAEKLAPGLWDQIPVLDDMLEYGPSHGRPFLSKVLGDGDIVGSHHWRHFFRVNVKAYAPGVYAVRYLDPAFCAQLVKAFKSVQFVPNTEEPVDAQIPELVLRDASYGLYECLRGLHAGYIQKLAAILFGQKVTECQSIQAARYTPENTPHGCWHTDHDSEATLVVALTDDHEGGGTEVYQGPMLPTITVPQLPVGWAMMFNGRHHLHQGLPVTKGERHLLVHWYKFSED